MQEDDNGRPTGAGTGVALIGAGYLKGAGGSQMPGWAHHEPQAETIRRSVPLMSGVVGWSTPSESTTWLSKGIRSSSIQEEISPPVISTAALLVPASCHA